MKKHKILLGIVAIALCTISVKTLAAVELQKVVVDLPSYKGAYTSPIETKMYESNQIYHCYANLSTNDTSVSHPVQVNLYKTGLSEKNTGYKTVSVGSSYTFNDSDYRNIGSYKIKVRNETWSIYKYMTSGIWQYSI